jgi:hypothetical protein
MWLTTFLFLAVPAAATQSAAHLPAEVAVPRSVRHKIVSNANHRTYKLMVFLPTVRLCREPLNRLAGSRAASGQSGVNRTFQGLEGAHLHRW